jgi:SAM-dependent methyltransferase
MADSRGTENREIGPSVSPELYTADLLLGFGSPEEYGAFRRSHGNALRPRFARALQLADLKPGMKVLDMGCGKGEVVFHAALSGAETYGLDYSPDSLHLSQGILELLSADARQRTLLVQADAKTIPLPDESLDRILMLDIVEHLYDWELRLALREAWRLLRPDGYLVVHTLPNRWALQIGYPLVRFFARALPATPRNEYERNVHVNEQDIVRLDRSLREVGLEARVWLEGLTKEQAAWQQGGQRFTDVRREAYTMLTSPFLASLYAFLLRSPARLLLANDIYAIAWKAGQTPPAVAQDGSWRGLSEKLCLGLTRG